MADRSKDRLFRARHLGRAFVAVLGATAPAALTAPAFAQDAAPVRPLRTIGEHPFANSMTEALSDAHLRRVFATAVAEGTLTEADRAAFLAMAIAQRTTIGDVQLVQPGAEFEWMMDQNDPAAGAGPERLRWAGTQPFRARVMTMTRSDRATVRFGVVMDTIDGRPCYNFFPESVTPAVGTPPPPPPPPNPITAPRSPAQWYLQEGVVAADCCQTRVVNGLLIAEYRGTVEEAQRYFAANLRRPGNGVQTLRPGDYQEGLNQPFAYLVVRDPSTGQETFWCMELNNSGRFSRPVVVTGGGRGEPSRRTEVRTRAQFDALVTGTLEFNENFSLTGSGRGADISVVSITEPTPLTVVDADRNGVGEGFAVNTRTRRAALESQMSLIARTVFPVSTEPAVNERADRLWAQIAATSIPEAFITGRTEGARISALRTAFPELTAVEARQLASFLHYYGGVDRGAERGDQFVAEYRTGGVPRTVGGFFNAGVGAEVTAGVYPGVRSGQ
ncbi:hypothetical protein K2P56_00255 [Patescibacteria group bacterium]|nr:hypothetical protein [Patescibacteria group bacterium]